VKGLNAVDSATQSTNVLGQDIEPADQGICAGNGYVVETNNIGEILVFNTSLQRKSSVIPLDTIMGLTGKGWSSGGDISCLYDYDHGGTGSLRNLCLPRRKPAAARFRLLCSRRQQLL